MDKFTDIDDAAHKPDSEWKQQVSSAAEQVYDLHFSQQRSDPWFGD